MYPILSLENKKPGAVRLDTEKNWVIKGGRGETFTLLDCYCFSFLRYLKILKQFRGVLRNFAREGDQKMFFFLGGAGVSVAVGARNPLKTIDFTEFGGGLCRHSPPPSENT